MSIRCPIRILAARPSALPTISPRSCRAAFGTMAPELEAGHIQEVGDEAVEALGLVNDRGEELSFFRVTKVVREVPQCARCSKYGGERGLEVVREGGEEGRAEAVGLRGALGPGDILDQAHPLDRQRSLIDQGVEQAPLIGTEEGSRPFAVNAHDADRAAAGAHRQEQSLGAGKRV